MPEIRDVRKGLDIRKVDIIAIIRGETLTHYRVCKDLTEAQERRGGAWVPKVDVERGAYLSNEGRICKKQYLRIPNWVVDLYQFERVETS